MKHWEYVEDGGLGEHTLSHFFVCFVLRLYPEALRAYSWIIPCDAGMEPKWAACKANAGHAVLSIAQAPPCHSCPHTGLNVNHEKVVLLGSWVVVGSRDLSRCLAVDWARVPLHTHSICPDLCTCFSFQHFVPVFITLIIGPWEEIFFLFPFYLCLLHFLFGSLIYKITHEFQICYVPAPGEVFFFYSFKVKVAVVTW